MLRFIIQTPRQDARVVPVAPHHLLQVALDDRPLFGIVDHVLARRRHPHGVVYTWNRLRLRSGIGVLDGTSVREEGHEDTHAVLVRQSHRLFEPLHESLRVFLPDYIAEEQPYGIESQVFSQRQFAVHHFRLEVFLPPYFNGRPAV